jgi:hypothetical protein
MKSNNNDRIDTALTSTNSRRQALKLMGGGLVGGLAMATGLKGVAAHGHKTQPVGELTSTFFDVSTIPGYGDLVEPAYSGVVNFVPRRFFNDGGQLMVTGDVMQGGEWLDTFSGPVLVDDPGTYVEEFASNNQMKIASVSGVQSDVSRMQQGGGSCEILNLVLGPIYLDLLGLVIETNQIELNIRAERGAGNLLGNLLCAVAGLLDGGPAAGLSGLLNRILRALGLA